MTLLELSPEAVRLRRMTRAVAAGELSDEDYRLARRSIIERFAYTHAKEDTQRRNDQTTRRMRRAPAVGFEPRDPFKRYLAGVLVVLLLVAGLAAQALGKTIPALADRDLNPVSGPRYEVKRIELEAPDEQMRLDGNALEQVLNAALATEHAANATLRHGFNTDELTEVGKFLNAVGVHENNGRLSPEDAKDLGALIQAQKSRRGLSLNQLEVISGKVAAFYRSQGYFLTEVYIPAQTLTDDGVVRMQVLPGKLSAVVVTRGDDALVQPLFRDMLGTVVTKAAVETRLYQLNRLPGIQATASFRPGADTGETDLNVNVSETRRLRGSVQMDNQGHQDLGETRIAFQGALLNPTGRGDSVNFGLLSSVSGGDQLYGFAGYETPVIDARHLARIRVSKLDFAWQGVDQTDVDAFEIDADLSRTVLSTRDVSLNTSIGLAHHQLNWSDDVDQRADFVRVGLRGHKLWDDLRLALSGHADVLAGRMSDPLPDQDEKFWALRSQVQVWRPLHVPFVSSELKVSMLLLGQLSGSRLPSTLRLGLGGASDLRGFEPGTFMADSGAVARLNLHVPLKLGELTFFSDYGYGDQAPDNGSSGWGELADIGVSWQAHLLPGLNSRLSVSKPVVLRAPRAENDIRVYWSVSYER
ncbi:MAG: hypothetical protein O3A63_13435 [Proteobacteria bacterium]|nr:hypothetical protein [Pseudomonadota bacterium]